MVDSYGEHIVAKVREIVSEVTMPLPVPDDEGLVSLVPFPETLLWGDEDRIQLLDGDVYEDWQPHLHDLVGRMAKEGVLLVLSALPDIGINVEDPLFTLIADLNASFYSRGYLIGLLAGADGAPADGRMENYLTAVQEDVDRQVAELGITDDTPLGEIE